LIINNAFHIVKPAATRAPPDSTTLDRIQRSVLCIELALQFYDQGLVN
jgi:hypothetical protein